MVLKYSDENNVISAPDLGGSLYWKGTSALESVIFCGCAPVILFLMAAASDLRSQNRKQERKDFLQFRSLSSSILKTTACGMG
jgi:hypothetical protein